MNKDIKYLVFGVCKMACGEMGIGSCSGGCSSDAFLRMGLLMGTSRAQQQR